MNAIKMDALIRRSSKEDLVEILGLFYNTVLNVCKDDYNHDQLMAWVSSASNKDKWLSKMEQTHFIVALAGVRIVGFASLADRGYVDILYVHKDFQKQGIASKLLSELERKAKTLEVDLISSDVSITARPFFENKGYALLRTNINLINGVNLINYEMTKKL